MWTRQNGKGEGRIGDEEGTGLMGFESDQGAISLSPSKNPFFFPPFFFVFSKLVSLLCPSLRPVTRIPHPPPPSGGIFMFALYFIGANHPPANEISSLTHQQSFIELSRPDNYVWLSEIIISEGSVAGGRSIPKGQEAFSQCRNGKMGKS